MYCYGFCDGNAAEARREYQRRFPDRRIPYLTVFSSTYRRLSETGSVQGRKIDTGRPRRYTANDQEEIIQRFINDPNTSTNIVARELECEAKKFNYGNVIDQDTLVELVQWVRTAIVRYLVKSEDENEISVIASRRPKRLKHELKTKEGKVTSKQLKKMWQNLKSKARDAKTITNQSKKTGGGPQPPQIGALESQVLAVMPNVMPTIAVDIDSDMLFKIFINLMPPQHINGCICRRHLRMRPPQIILSPRSRLDKDQVIASRLFELGAFSEEMHAAMAACLRNK
ncbi:unnamed protein product [Colias eurytheme]|nr:unnamed protein product [Colias eurytheme]